MADFVLVAGPTPKYIGLSTDTKPTGVAAGSICEESDTDIKFVTLNGTDWVARDLLVRLVAGTAAIGKLAANSGVDIGDVDVTSVIPGTGATNLAKAVDAVAGAADSGVALLAVRDDALGALTPVEGDYVQPRTDANGALWTHDDALDAALSGSELQVDVVAALPAGTAIVGKVGIDQTTPGTTNAVAATVYDDALTRETAQAIRGTQDGVAAANYPLLNGQWILAGDDNKWYRQRAVSNTGAGTGVLRVGNMGELITLAASAARTESANGTATTGLGWRNRYIILFDLTVADTDAGDTLDVYVDVSLDGNTWLNAVHFTQIIGTDAASKRYAVLDPSAPGTSEILVTADAAAGAVRPSMFGAQMRARWAIVDVGGDDASFTFSVTAYAI